jgi:hypothetical protein
MKTWKQSVLFGMAAIIAIIFMFVACPEDGKSPRMTIIIMETMAVKTQAVTGMAMVVMTKVERGINWPTPMFAAGNACLHLLI